jgi:homoserine dehydrogenase
LGWQELKAAEILDNDEALSEAYLRLLVADDKGVLANISQILANFDISIENMVQHPEGDNARIAIITSSVSGKKLKLACDELNQQEFSKEEVHMLNVETFNN